ncbi:helix-turn-helix domain-containing protein [Streptomyces sp. NPDC001194]|uniref:helix-turn-helix domain-containing protein n=1 Tax=Streptomyces sp. NPDC001194 TaxID=3364547 RepID=UPI0036936684
MTQDPQPGDGEDNVAAHVRFERGLRGWSTAELARYVTEAGCPISQSAVWRIESGEPRRKITVDELIAFAKVFGKGVHDLLRPPTTEYPEALVSSYIDSWLEKEMTVWRKDLDARVAYMDIIAILSAYPGAVPHFAELVSDRVEQRELVVLRAKVQTALENLSSYLGAKGARTSLLTNGQPLVAHWKKLGMSHGQMFKEAERVGLKDVMFGGLAAHLEALEADVAPAQEAEGGRSKP